MSLKKRWKFDVFIQKPFSWKFRFSIVTGLESIPATLFKRESTSEVFHYGVRKIAFLKISARTLAIPFQVIPIIDLQLQASSCRIQLQFNFTENDLLTKIYRTNFQLERRFILCKRQYLYLDADAKIWKWSTWSSLTFPSLTKQALGGIVKYRRFGNLKKSMKELLFVHRYWW